MSRRIIVITLAAAFTIPLVISGCNDSAVQNELADLKAALAQTEGERDNYKSKMNAVVEARDVLQTQVAELTTSRDELQAKVKNLQEQVGALTASRELLQNNVTGLTESRDAAVAESRDAKTRIDDLTTQLGLEKQKVTELQNQLKNVQTAIKELQQKLGF